MKSKIHAGVLPLNSNESPEDNDESSIRVDFLPHNHHSHRGDNSFEDTAKKDLLKNALSKDLDEPDPDVWCQVLFKGDFLELKPG